MNPNSIHKKVFILDSDTDQSKAFCDLLEAENYFADIVSSLVHLHDYLAKELCLAVFIDVDTVSVTNRDIRELSVEYPSVYFFCLSKEKVHPELKDAIGQYVYACINRPIDLDELHYWLRTISAEDGKKGRTI
jgi:DNA-binding NtrC family response regulator